VTASIGIALFPQQSDDADILVRFADMAMYVAKQSGKNQVSYHDPDLARASIHHFELLQSIKKGFESGEFELYYQPKVSMREGRVVGVEALLRWRHPQRGLLSPAEFLEVLDASELAISAGCWVLREVVRQADTWRRQGICLDVSINVSSKHFEFPDFLCDLKAALAEAPDLPRNTLEIEIGESDALRNSDYTERVISECAALGVSCAIDDYGKQSFANSDMPRLPAHTLKLDRCIIADLLHNSADLALIDGIIALATTYQQDVVAKGIESAEHAQMLIKMGCDMAQGYGIASPMSAREIPAWIDAYDLELCGHQAAQRTGSSSPSDGVTKQ